MKGLYIHLPFCKTICTYCDFAKQMAKEEQKDRYIEAVLQELTEKKAELTDIRSVYFGGGTPNALSIRQLKRLLDSLEEILSQSSENTIEVNAELLTEEQIELFARFHINRISIGVQTFDAQLLKKIGRHHRFEQVRNGIKLMKKHGIHNINLDLMFALPGQTLKQVQEDIRIALELPITHLSYYSLILEEKTVLNYQLKHGQIILPDDDLVADMHDYIHQTLKMSAFKQYEISNYAKEGYASVHNLGYWNCEDYIGIGASAVGFLQGVRYQNEWSLPAYFKHRLKEKQILSLQEQKEEFMMMGLRKIDGILISEYHRRFFSYPWEDFLLQPLLDKGWIEMTKEKIKIKEERIFISNTVFEAYVS